MSDFLLDFRDAPQRTPDKAVRMLRFFDDLEGETIARDAFSLVLVRGDWTADWRSHVSDGSNLLVALSGRVFLEPSEWADAERIPGAGGNACKAISAIYRDKGLPGLGRLNGNFVVIIHDPSVNKLHLVTDRCGMHPCFTTGEGTRRVIGSHPDVVADVAGFPEDLDKASLCEFLVTGKVSFPNSYHASVKALDFGSVHTIDLHEGRKAGALVSRKLSPIEYRIDPRRSEWDLAEELAQSFRNAVRRRTLPRFGQTAISLSGGLDSRAILCSTADPSRVSTFCFFDEENLEFDIARRIAGKAGARFIPLQRRFEHYGEHAPMGTRISGGMGDFGSNHYLGFRDAFRAHGLDNIVAGFYCDYFFKGLLLDKQVHRYLNRQSLSNFQEESYMPHFWFDTPAGKAVRARMNEAFPSRMTGDTSDVGRLHVERKRLFPLCYEPDHQETVVPQRVLGWSLPIVDNDIVDTYLKIPPGMKLNVSLYSKMVTIACGKEISAIPNINTGAPVGASAARLLFHRYGNAVKRRLSKRKHTIASDESWPNWPYYIANSPELSNLWLRKNDTARDLLREVMGVDPFARTIREYHGRGLKLFLRLLTAKIWIDLRSGVLSPPERAGN